MGDHVKSSLIAHKDSWSFLHSLSGGPESDAVDSSNCWDCYRRASRRRANRVVPAHEALLSEAIVVSLGDGGAGIRWQAAVGSGVGIGCDGFGAVQRPAEFDLV
ncbi:hypothetical protein Q1695_000607 [Nippostrongylus brasiliensis]|nr:hypothetical protein Q1695_000607 [Nippostrongylus brasiliensis]